jgi:undecaprenyl diphosphate synthase
MDGNGRWAQRHGKSRIEGHRKGVENVRRIVKASRNLGIQHITLYAFSIENWRRPKSEISALMSLLNLYLKKELEELLKNGVRLNVIGRTDDLPKNVRKTLCDTIEKTKSNTRQILTLALNYGARTEIVDAVRTYASLVKAGTVDPAELDWETFSGCLYTHNLPDPDLIIRTSGEHRLSNFLLLQAAYTEIYFTPLCWPEFLPENLIEAIQNFHGRERRYGQTGEQLKKVNKSTAQV